MFDWTRTSQCCLEEFWEGLVEIAQINSIMCNQGICCDWRVPAGRDDKGWWLRGWNLLVSARRRPTAWMSVCMNNGEKRDFGDKMMILLWKHPPLTRWLVCGVIFSFCGYFGSQINATNVRLFLKLRWIKYCLARFVFFFRMVQRRSILHLKQNKCIMNQFGTDIVRGWREYMSSTGKCLNNPWHKSHLLKQYLSLPDSCSLSDRFMALYVLHTYVMCVCVCVCEGGGGWIYVQYVFIYIYIK